LWHGLKATSSLTFGKGTDVAIYIRAQSAIPNRWKIGAEAIPALNIHQALVVGVLGGNTSSVCAGAIGLVGTEDSVLARQVVFFWMLRQAEAILALAGIQTACFSWALYISSQA
jgi:hypothetical protein